MNNFFDVSGKVIVITGGGGVLCSEMAIGLADVGATVILLGRTVEKLAKVASKIKESSRKADFMVCDVMNKVAVQECCDLVVSNYERVDVLINGAGGNKKEATTGPDMSFFDLDIEAMAEVYALNFVGTLVPSQVFGRKMGEQGNGVILNVSSMSAERPLTKVIGYGTAKAAVNNFTKWLSVYMCQNVSRYIRVNAIAPGFFLTEQNRFLLTDKVSGELTARGQTIKDHTPMGRFGDPKDLVGTVIWLCSDASKFVTGAVVPVDGGFNAFSGV